jgi:ribonucleoside-diphosphate reductase alpha chain
VTSSSPPTGDVRDCEPTSVEVRAAFPTASEIAPEWHLRMHAAMPPCRRRRVQGGEPPGTAIPDDVGAIYLAAWKVKAEGITLYRHGQVLTFAASERRFPEPTPLSAAGAPAESLTSDPRRRGPSGHPVGDQSLLTG